MTGELADCYETKAAGVSSPSSKRHSRLQVKRNSASTSSMAALLSHGKPSRIRCLQPPAIGTRWPVLRLVSWTSSPALLIDLGTTTCDIIPIIDGKPATRGTTDPERLAAGELVYSGVERTPLFALVDAFEIGGQINTARAPELFRYNGGRLRAPRRLARRRAQHRYRRRSTPHQASRSCTHCPKYLR